MLSARLPGFSARLPTSLQSLSLQSLSRHPRRLVRRPARLTLGTAAATVVVVAGVTTALAAGSAPAGGVISSTAAADHASSSHANGSHASSSHSASHGTAAHQATPASHHAPSQSHHSAAPARHTRQQPAKRHQVSVHHKAPAQHHAPAKPYLIYDSITPSAIPAHRAAAVYATGNYAASPHEVAGHNSVLWIDTTGSDHAASVLDVEPGDATPTVAAAWAKDRLTADPHALARIYTMRSEWSAVQAAVATLPAKMRSQIRWWIADPTGTPHIVPGSAATQWYWGSSYDITTASPRF